MALKNANYKSLNVERCSVKQIYYDSTPGADEVPMGGVFLKTNGNLGSEYNEFKWNDLIVANSDPTGSIAAADLYSTEHFYRVPAAIATDTLPSATALIAEMTDTSVGSTIIRKWTAGSVNDITLVLGAGMTNIGSNLTIYSGQSSDIYFVVTGATTMDVYIV